MSPHQLLVHYIRGSSTNTDDLACLRQTSPSKHTRNSHIIPTSILIQMLLPIAIFAKKFMRRQSSLIRIPVTKCFSNH